MQHNLKPFTNIDDQICLLRSRGVEIDDDTAHILKCEGYYSVVNGYKDPFIDPDASALANDDRYRAGTRFSDIYSLFLFDRDLRELTFHYLLRIEALVRTISAYTFAEFHDGHEDYLKPESFATEQEYSELGLTAYHDNMHDLHTKLRAAIRYPKNEAVRYYQERYGSVPIWVLMSTLTFGNIEHFFNLMKRPEQNLICKRVLEVTGRSDERLAPIRARRALDILVKYRNICAHDERLYCASVDRRNPVNYMDFMHRYARPFMTRDNHEKFSSQIITAVGKYASESGTLVHILARMGFALLDDSAENNTDRDS